ncbi:MAG: hypothetical protein PUE01_06690 [Clostridiaceae bacterium]|nr:hypothetical protein [Clostridiaceae bacterium]
MNFHIIEKDLEAKGERLGTYGVIKVATTFLGVSVENTELGLEAAGYEFLSKDNETIEQILEVGM